MCGGLYGALEDGRVEVRTAGGTKTTGNWHDGRACVNKNEGDCRGRPVVDENCRVWVRTAGFG